MPSGSGSVVVVSASVAAVAVVVVSIGVVVVVASASVETGVAAAAKVVATPGEVVEVTSDVDVSLSDEPPQAAATSKKASSVKVVRFIDYLSPDSTIQTG